MSEVNMVIPDSVEPYRGFKALNVGGGTLHSPNQSVTWPARKRLEANCSAGLSHWGWCPVEGEPRDMEAVQTVPQGWGMMVMTAVAASSTTRSLVPPAKPNNPLPPGWNWSWEPLTHDAPAEGCQCGIYVADKPEGCLSYIGPSGIIAEIALWGKVIPASAGARGQYAYPTRLLVPQSVRDHNVVAVEEAYGIQSLILEEPLPPPEPPPPPPLPRVNKPPAVLFPKPGESLRDLVQAEFTKLFGKKP